MNNNEDIPVPKKIAETLDLGRYAVPLDSELMAGRRKREQQARMDNYFVKLPLKLFALSAAAPTGDKSGG